MNNVSDYTLVDCIDMVKHETETIESALRRLHMHMEPTSETKEIQKSTKSLSELVVRMAELTGK